MPANELALDATIESQLPFDREQQLAFLGHVLNHERFFFQVKDTIKGAWFLDGYAGKLFDLYVEFHKLLLRTPVSKEEFLKYDRIRAMSQEDRQKITNTYVQADALRLKFGSDLLLSELTNWMRCRIYHSRVAESSRLFNSRQLNQAVSVLETAIKEFQNVRYDGSPSADFSNPRALVEAQNVDLEGALTTGISILDRHLHPLGPFPSNASCGPALLLGDTTVLLAPTNVGKTTTMITIARHNLALGKSVLFVTLEGRELDIQEKIWCCTLGRTRAEFRRLALSDDEQDKKLMFGMSQVLMNQLNYVSMVHEQTVEEVVRVIRHKQNQRKAVTGKGYDLLVVDYPAILTTDQARMGGRFDYRQIQGQVYRAFVQLALQERFHALLAVQSNREGAKTNRNAGFDRTHQHRLLTPEDVSESYDIAMSATNIITVNRDEAAKAADRVTFYICKSRSSQTGWAVVCKSSYGTATTHSNALGGLAYEGSVNATDRIQGFLKERNNCDINLSEVLGK